MLIFTLAALGREFVLFNYTPHASQLHLSRERFIRDDPNDGELPAVQNGRGMIAARSDRCDPMLIIAQFLWQFPPCQSTNRI